MNPDTARPTREPETAAGRLLLAASVKATDLARIRPVLVEEVLAIEAELRASLAEPEEPWQWPEYDPELSGTEYHGPRLSQPTDPASPRDIMDTTVSTEEWRAVNRGIAERDKVPLVFHASCGCFEQEGGSVGLCDWHRRRNMLDREPRSLSEPLDAEGAVAEMVGVESSIDEAMRRAKRVTATLAGIARLATDPSAPEQEGETDV